MTTVEPLAAPDPATTNWVPVGPGPPVAVGGSELAYAEITNPVSLTGTPTTIVSSGSIIYDGSPIEIEFSAIIGVNYGDQCILTLFDGATNLGYFGQFYSPGASGSTYMVGTTLTRRLTPTPGPHNYQVVGTGSTASISAGVGGAGNYMPACMRITRGSSVVTSTTASYGTTLPASPYDGQEAILVDSITNPTYQWRFRYNAGSSSAYKWEFIGGPPFSVSAGLSDTGFITVANAWTDQSPNPHPLFVVPRAGDYTAMAGCTAGGPNTPVNGQNQIAICNGAVDPTADSAIAIAYTPFAGSWVTETVTDVKRGVAAGSDIRVRYYANGGVGQASRWMRVWPVRVS